MLGFTFRRLLLIVPTVLGTVTILFVAFFLLPGGPNKTAELLAGGGGDRAVSPVTLENVKKQNGLDKPLPVQYGRYIKRLATGDLGHSYKNKNRSINAMVKEKAPASLRLAAWAMIIETIIGIAAGVLSAVKKYSFADGLVTVLTTLALAIPVFVLGLLFQLAFSVYPNQHDWPQWLRLEPARIGPNSWMLGFIPTKDQWRYLVSPAITLACVNTAVVARLMRSTMLEVGEADYVRTARAKGASRWSVVMKHSLRNALIPVVTLIGLDFGTLIGAAVLTETVFGWPGIGSEIATAARGRDAPVVIGLTVVVVVAIAFVTLIVDLSYAALDPRIRLNDKK